MPSLKITFLGTGTSQGVPVIGCDCDVCLSDDPRDKRLRASVYLVTPEAQWVIDTGPDFRMQCLRANIRHLDAVVYTHSHTDHVMGFDDLRRFCMIKNGPIPVYASRETLATLSQVFEFAFNGKNRFPGYVLPDPRPVVGTFRLGGLDVTPLPLPHGRTTSTGYLHEKDGKKLFAYLTDCNIVPDAVIERVRGVEHLVIDALRDDPHPTHLTISEAIEAADRIGPKQTWLTHLCDHVSHKKRSESLPDGVRLAYDGLEIEIE